MTTASLHPDTEANPLKSHPKVAIAAPADARLYAAMLTGRKVAVRMPSQVETYHGEILDFIDRVSLWFQPLSPLTGEPDGESFELNLHEVSEITVWG